MKCLVFTLIGMMVADSLGAEVDKCTDILGSREGTYGAAKIKDVRISDCPESPCRLLKGKDVTVEFDFTPDKPYEKLTASVYGGLGLIRVPFRGVNGGDACKNIYKKSDGKKGCPLEKGEVYTYTNTIPILKFYPAVPVSVQYGVNDGKNPVVCFTLPAKIVNS